MIVLDADVLIAFLDGDDANNGAATELLLDHADQALAMSPLNRAEVLVGPARDDRLDETVGLMEVLELEDVPMPGDAPVRLARLRASTGSKLPDCCVLLAAQQEQASVATFDDRLRRSAQTLGLQVL